MRSMVVEDNMQVCANEVHICGHHIIKIFL
jgi:hypothetical protein